MLYSQEYLDYLHSQEWDDLRKAAYRKANMRCEHCRRTKVSLHAHHTIYRTPISHGKLTDLLVLCERCHNQWHKWRDKQDRGLLFDREQTKAALQRIIPIQEKKKRKFIRGRQNQAKPDSKGNTKSSERKRIFKMCREIERRRMLERRKNDSEMMRRSRLINSKPHLQP